MIKYSHRLITILSLIVLLFSQGVTASAQPLSNTYYLFPPNLHLVSGDTSAVPLSIIDQNGDPVVGTISFFGYDTSLISISASGHVTALRTEGPTEIGTWVSATINGSYTTNTSVVRVLSNHYSAPFAYVTRTHTALYYPASLSGEDLASLVSLYQIPNGNEYAYQIQYSLMNLSIFNGARQIFEVDFGETEQQRVCGISGNPIRLGWNVQGNAWQNCFLVPFINPRSPQWFVMHHELGHNFSWASKTFADGLGILVYSEGIASLLSITDLSTILQHPDQYPLGTDATASVNQQFTMYKNNFITNYQAWLDSGANFNQLNADIVDGIWLHYQSLRPADFASRFFKPLRPMYYPFLAGLVSNLSNSDRHTIFAALVSAALKQDLSNEFTANYHYPLNSTLFINAYAAFGQIIDPACLVYMPIVQK